MEQTSSMGSGPGYPHPQQQGMPGGPQQMPNGNMMRPMQGAPMNNFQPHGVPPNMGNPGMGLPMGAPGNAMSPGMVPGPGHNMMMTNAYRQSMTATTKTLLAAAAPGASEQGFHPVQGQQQFVGSQNNRIGQNLAQAKPMGGMAPPASPAIGGPMKDQKDVKPMINNPSGMPEGSPHNAPAAPGQGGSSSNPTGSAHGTAPPTPNTINSSITQSPAPNGTPSVPPASNPTSCNRCHGRYDFFRAMCLLHPSCFSNILQFLRVHVFFCADPLFSLSSRGIRMSYLLQKLQRAVTSWLLPVLDSLFLSSTCCDSSSCCLLPRSVTLSHLASGRRRRLLRSAQCRRSLKLRIRTTYCYRGCIFEVSHILQHPSVYRLVFNGHLTCSAGSPRRLCRR
ncbi:hypothetical protein BDR06DRAFT_184534 [Suillus hirtellus]|nr:hypothetical protein BDR06DRAFT_184534 [Suillus hirtellus]